MSSQIAAKLSLSCRMRAGRRHEPPVQVLAALAPAADVDAADVADGPDGALDPLHQRPQLGRELGRQRLDVVVLLRLEDQDERQPGRPERRQLPVLVLPDQVVRGLAAGVAVDPALAVARLLVLPRAAASARGRISPVERERLPLLDGRHPQRVLGALVELFGRLGHRRADANVGRVEWPQSFYELQAR